MSRTLLILIGAIFALLASASAYLISYHEYRQRMLRLDQNPKKMAANTAIATFVFMLIAAIVLAFVLVPNG